jgi:hypothetical protein
MKYIKLFEGFNFFKKKNVRYESLSDINDYLKFIFYNDIKGKNIITKLEGDNFIVIKLTPYGKILIKLNYQIKNFDIENQIINIIVKEGDKIDNLSINSDNFKNDIISDIKMRLNIK